MSSPDTFAADCLAEIEKGFLAAWDLVNTAHGWTTAKTTTLGKTYIFYLT